MRICRKLSVLGTAVVLAAVVAACGSSVPSNSVASVAGNPITLQAFNHWMYVYAAEEAAQQGSKTVINPISPPNFETCLQQISTQLPSLKKESKKTLRSDCSSLFSSYKSAVMGYLVQSYWYQLEGHKNGITVTDAQVQKALAQEKKSAGPQFATELKASGETMSDLLWQIRVSQIYQKLIKKQTKPITSASIAQYYKTHSSSFGTQATATAHIVKASSASDAQAAAAALKSGSGWSTVASKYSSTAAGKKNGGLTSVTSGDQEQVVDRAIFASALNTVVGPLHGTFGWYVIEVTKRTAATHQSLAQSTPEIKQLLKQSNAQAAATSVLNTAKRAWKGKTQCVAAYSIDSCANYVPPKKTTTAPATTTGAGAGGASSTGTSPASTGTGTGAASTGTGGAGTGTGTGAAGTGTGAGGASTGTGAASTGTGSSTTGKSSKSSG